MPRTATVRVFFFLIALALSSYSLTEHQNGSEAKTPPEISGKKERMATRLSPAVIENLRNMSPDI